MNQIIKDYRKIYVKDFGAMGDELTDDSKAIATAIEFACTLKEKVAVIFEPNSKYKIAKYEYSSTFPMLSALMLDTVSDMLFIGDNTTIIVSTPLKAICIRGCENIEINGFNFDYSPKFALNAQILDYNYENLMFKVKTTEALNFETNTFNSSEIVPDFFGLPESDSHKYSREHMYIDRYEKTDDSLIYKIFFRRDETIEARMKLTIENKYNFILPVPNVAHTIGEAYYIGFSKDIRFLNCEIWAAPHFAFALKGNSGDLFFDNVHIRPNPYSDVPIAGWRDGFHCKDNRGAIHWNNCSVEKIHDDTFNISSTLLYIKEIISKTEIVISCSEMNGAYYPMYEGDEITVYNVKTGDMVGNLHITEVKEQNGPVNRIIVDTECDFTIGDRVAFDSLAAPGSTIDNCVIDGTVRYRGALTVKNSIFKLLIMWIQNEILFEGPIPKNILFENCKFEPYHSKGNMITVLTEMEGDAVPNYKCKNIVFKNCDINQDQVYVENNNDVKFI